MKKLLFLLIFVVFSVSSYAIDLPNRSIFMEGTASVAAHRTFFMNNFRMEAAALGYTVTENRNQAGFTFKFEVHNHSDEDDPSIKFIVLITLTYNETNMEMVSFGWPFADIEDMYEYNQFVFYKAAVLIPGVSDDDIAALAQSAGSAVDNSWQNQLIYFRISVNYPISCYQLQPDGLFGGNAVWAAPWPPTDYQNIENQIMPQPGVTVGLEFQLLNFLSLEFNFQAVLGDMKDNTFINMAVGAELKFPIKLSSIVFQPYGAFLYPLNVSPVFAEYPDFFFGGGLQIGVRGGKSGSFFIDVNYMTSLTDVYRRNPYEHYQEPEVIRYNRFVVGLGIGYKFGFFDRNSL